MKESCKFISHQNYLLYFKLSYCITLQIVFLSCIKVLFAFMVGLHNLYWYYGSRTYKVKADDGSEKILHASEAFQGWVSQLLLAFQHVYTGGLQLPYARTPSLRVAGWGAIVFADWETFPREDGCLEHFHKQCILSSYCILRPNK